MRLVLSFLQRGCGPVLPLLLFTFLLLFAPSAVTAGSICGQVTDSDTGFPVMGAGIFVRHGNGTYAEALAVSDAGGDWCVHDLVAGTYTIEVRVDDYVTAYVNGVTVADDVSDVPLSLARLAFSLDPPWPNPASAGVKMRLHVAVPIPIELGVYDLRGRLVRSWLADRVEAGTRDYFWDGLDASGRPAPSGLYLIRARSTATEIVRPLVLTR